MVHLLGGLCLDRVDLPGCLGAERFEFFGVCLHFPGAHITAQSGVRPDTGPVFRFNEDFEIGLDVRLVADFGEQERIDVAAGRDEVEIAANAGLGRVDVAEVVRAVDDPEFLVAGGEIEDLFVVG